jgi:methylated-DNA-[protein]-cysteine S-methyltransferase
VIALLRLPSTSIIGSSGRWVCFAAADDGIAACTLPHRTAGDALAEVDSRWAAPARGDSLIPRVAQELRRYFAGDKARLDFPLDLSRARDFTRRVLSAVASIPYGQTRSYAWVAQAVGCPRAARAVGQVMARNPLAPIVPCHRVIGADRSLIGFGGGLDFKRCLLEMEGAAAGRGKD